MSIEEATKKFDWTQSELLYFDLGFLNESLKKEIFIFHDGDGWMVLEAGFDGYRLGHFTDDSGKSFDDIEAARIFAEKLIARYEKEAPKEKSESNSDD